MKRQTLMRVGWSACLIALLGFVSVPDVQASLVTFDFNSVPDGTNSSNSGDAIDSYMTGLWGSDVNVKKGARAVDDPPENRNQLYLGNTDGYVGRGKDPVAPNPDKDIYLHNRWNNTCAGCDRITIQFLDVGIHYFEVDWQLFPITRNGDDKADLRILADGVELFYASLEPVGNVARENGLLGVFTSAGFTAPDGGWHTLEFVDWNSAPVGIDNLRADPEVPVPEPATLALLGGGLAGLGLRRRRRA